MATSEGQPPAPPHISSLLGRGDHLAGSPQELPKHTAARYLLPLPPPGNEVALLLIQRIPPHLSPRPHLSPVPVIFKVLVFISPPPHF